ncbi:3D-(3,5/4)-trihydroxycyclohexane-1,2-dione acylhydrolase (decyclizing) [Clostridium nigeriense]|uniref:3D-(3,5/4)-trihydroxycyclohexane-1,2-dione acylhydrolase (decyclizing) n=1 Tax=Clostridium nigeriense TaxID=1805470 RepID=UPI000836CC7E|nr:3D-(3,5/4)-trihydroxycyclohexane-1,2-dione acylhydrolase (decyclizing) [Clostridium nigeriense]
MNTIRMTMGQAIVKFLDNQYVSFDGIETKFVDGIFTVFGHGIVCGLGQALDENRGNLKVYQGKNEQGMAHVATSFAKQNNRRKIIACASSIGPGAANMVTAAATATVNNIPLLLLPGDSFASRQPDPVLQQIEQWNNPSVTTNDAFKAVCKYWDRISRPEQVMSSLISAMRVLTDPSETGACCLAIPQDVQGESYDYPEDFFKKRVYEIRRFYPCKEEIQLAVEVIKESKYPMLICGGGVRYSEAGEVLEKFSKELNIPIGETQAGKSACRGNFENNLGGVGVTGNLAANTIAENADLVIGVGTRFSDFTTASKSLFKNRNVKFININTSRFHAFKLDSVSVVGDAKISLEIILEELKGKYLSSYGNEIMEVKKQWDEEMKKLTSYHYNDNFEPLIKARNESSINEFIELFGSSLTQTEVIGKIREIIDDDAIIVGASGSLPGCLQRMWETNSRYSYNMEYGYSCMGYEIAGALGSKMADKDKEVYAMVGDGSFLMLHSEMVTALQENKKINILLFDNCGFGCINNLQMSNGIGNLATEFRYRSDDINENGSLISIDYAKVASGYGYKTYRVRTIEELEEALIDSKKQNIGTLLDIKILPKTMTDGYKAWWHVGIAETSLNEKVNEAYKNKEKNRLNARRY